MPGGAAAETGHSGGNHVLSLDADRPAAHTPQEPPTPPSSPPAKLLGFAAGSFYGEPLLPFLLMPNPPAQVERLTTPRPPRAPMARDLEAMHQRLFTLQRVLSVIGGVNIGIGGPISRNNRSKRAFWNF